MSIHDNTRANYLDIQTLLLCFTDPKMSSLPQEFAAKLEAANAKHPQLNFEARLYRTLSGGKGIPSIRWHGHEGNYNVLIIELLGHSLEELFNMCGRQFR